MELVVAISIPSSSNFGQPSNVPNKCPSILIYKKVKQIEILLKKKMYGEVPTQKLFWCLKYFDIYRTYIAV